MRQRPTFLSSRLTISAHILLLLVAALGLTLPPPRAHAVGALVVNTTSPNINDDQQPLCSLPEAMMSATATRANDDCPEVDGPALITFAVSGPIKPNDQLPNIGDGDNVSLLGPVTIDLSTGGTLPFDLDGGTLNMSLISIVKGATTAINISSPGTVNLAGVSFDGNSTQASGGAITNRGVLRIAGSNFVGNTAAGDGGAIENYGELTIAASNFSGNSAKFRGGALYLGGGKAEISDSLFSGNVAQTDLENDGGGAIFITSNNTMTSTEITRVGFSGNLAIQASGGAINAYATAPLTVTSSSFQGNLAGNPTVTKARGGAIISRGLLSVSGSSFLNNAASGDGGAVSNEGAGRLTLVNTSFTANAAAGKGGALINRNPGDISADETRTITATNLTFSSNAALDGGGIYNVEPKYDPILLTNSIIDGSDATGGNCADGDQQTPTVLSGGHNLDSGTSCGLGQPGDKSGLSAKLDSPGFNGGPLVTLLTQKLNPGSPAIDAGDPAVCAAKLVGNRDQRNNQRPLDGDGDSTAICDIGSFENDAAIAGFGGTPLPPGPINFGNTTIGTPINASLSLFETGNTTLTVSSAALGGSNPGDFAVVSPLPVVLPDGAAAASIELRCTPSAVGARLAKLTLSSSDPAKPNSSYDLICNGTPQPAAGFSATPPAPGPLSFGAVVVGVEATKSITVAENGTAQLKVNTPLLGGSNPSDFSVDPSLSLSIDQGGAAQPLAVKCKPSDYGIRTATLTLSTNDPTKQQVSFNLACSGVQPLSPALETTGQSVSNTSAASGNTPYGLAISPDGAHVYVADSGTNEVSALTRAPNTGSLTLTQPEYEDEFAGGPNMKGAGMVTVSPDGRNVYVSAGLSGNFFFNDSDNAVTAFKRDPSTGALSLLDTVKQGDDYGCPSFGGGACAGKVSGLTGAYGVVVSPDGRFVYASSINDSAIVVLRRSADGGLDTKPPFGASSANFVTKTLDPDLKGAYGMALSPDGGYLYATGYTSPSALLVFKRNASDGTLSHVETKKAAGTPGLSGVFRVTVSPDGNFVYTAAYNSSSLTAWRRSQLDGRLSYLATYTNGQGGIDGLGSASALAVSPDGTRLYATGYSSNAVAVFDRDFDTGLLSFHEAVKRAASGLPALKGARDIVVSPDGESIHITGFGDGKVVTLRVANPVPLLSSLSPASALASGSALTLTVLGANFAEGAEVRWNGAARPTKRVSSGELRATLSPGDLASAGSVPVTVFNPAPGGGASNARAFTITAPNQNPVPALSQLVPQGVTAGSAALIVEVAGSGFLPTSKVRWNGVERATVYVSSSKLQAQIAAADLAAPGDAGVSVVSPGPGGGASNAANFTIAAPGENPPPTIQRAEPPSAIAGANDSQLDLTVVGQSFLPTSKASWNGASRPTTYLSPTALLLTVSAADLATPGAASIVVSNPTPGGGDSNVVAFTIGAVGDNPVPVVSGVRFTIGAGGAATLVVSGAGFVSGSQIVWNGTPRATTVDGSGQLTAALTLAEIATTPAVVGVANPAPGGGPSNEYLFDPRRLNLPLVKR